MTNTALDLDAYFRRIGYTSTREPTLDTLRAIHLQHVQAIPFENLNPFLGWPVRLDLQSLQQKLVIDGRGGYCFEQNILLTHVLRGLGFRVTWMAARVGANLSTDAPTARTHMLLLVSLGDDPYVVDVGFGGLTLTSPLRLEADTEQTTPHEPFRLVKVGEEFLMQARFGGVWNSLYRFGLQEQLLPDYEVTNWYLSNHPESRFVTSLIAARPDSHCRYALRNNELAVHHLGGSTERQVLKSTVELHDTLREVFRLKLPDVPELRKALARIVELSSEEGSGM